MTNIMANRLRAVGYRLLHIVRGFMIGITVFLFALCAWLYYTQQRMLYPVPSNYAQHLPIFMEQLRVTTADGLELTAAYHAARDDLPTLIYFHGNADSLATSVAAVHLYHEYGYGVFLVEYRGYGGNGGAPSEAGLYQDGEAALAWLAHQGVPPQDIVILGHSMGSGPASEMALRYSVRGLVLFAAFSSLPDAVRDRVGWLPLHFMVRDQYDSVTKLPQITAPILLVHGTSDRVVAYASMARLARANAAATQLSIAGAGHGVPYLVDVQQAVIDWMATLPSRPVPSPSPVLPVPVPAAP